MNRKSQALCVAASLLALATVPHPASAQVATSAPTSEDTGLAEIVVTALRRSENLQSTASSVDVVTSEELVARGITDLRGLTNLLPAVNLNAEDQSTQIFIRGIGQTSDSDTNSPAVAVNFDGVYNPRFSLSASMFDIDRVEVLPGPQGLLYGRNAAGGAVNINTRKPGSVYEADGSLEAGNYALFHASAGADLPLTNDFALRAAFDVLRHKGYLSDGQDDADSTAGRLTGIYTPTESLSILLRGEINHSGGRGDGAVAYPVINPKDPWYEPTAPGDRFYRDFRTYKANAEVNYKFDNFTVTYIPAFVYYNDKTRLPISVPALAPSLLPIAAAPYGGQLNGGPGGYFAAALELFGINQHQYSNEIRIASNDASTTAGSISWVAGFYQLLSRVNDPGFAFELYNPASFTGGPIEPYVVSTGGGANFDRVLGKSYAAFSQATYSITDTWRLLAGLRYSRDSQNANGVIQTYLPATPVAVVPFTGGALVDYNGTTATPAANFNLDQVDHHVDWKVGLQHDLTQSSMLYANMQTGYNEGGFNLIPLNSSANSFKPETLLAYSAGSKNSFFDNRLRINDEIFYYDYKDLQVSAFNLAAGGAILVNMPKSRIFGNQLDVAYKVFSQTVVTFNIAYLNARISRGVLAPATIYGPPQYPVCAAPIPAALCSPTSLVDYKGHALPNSPPVSANLSLSQVWKFQNGGSLEGLVGSHFQAPYWGQYSEIAGLHRPSYTQTDLSLTYHFLDGRWSIAGWLKNAENSAVYVSPATDSIYGQSPSYIGPPRTFGVRFGFNFGG